MAGNVAETRERGINMIRLRTAAATAAIGVAAVLLPMVVSPANAATCDPRYTGTALAEEIRGDSRGNNICGRGGSDVLYGRGGPDNIWGDGFGDHMEGGDGSDYLVGGYGFDQVYGGRGDDSLEGGPGPDWLHPEFGWDYPTYGGPGDDDIYTSDGDGLSETVHCGPGDDFASVDPEDVTFGCEAVV